MLAANSSGSSGAIFPCPFTDCKQSNCTSIASTGSSKTENPVAIAPRTIIFCMQRSITELHPHRNLLMCVLRVMDKEKTIFSDPAGLQRLVKICLLLLREKESSSLTTEVCEGLLAPEPSPPSSSSSSPATTVTTAAKRDDHVLLGYPGYPLYIRLSDSIAHWMATRRCPVLDLPDMYLLNEQESLGERLEPSDFIVRDASSHWEHWSEEEKKSAILKLLNSLGFRGVLDLLGVRRTIGSCDCLPPSASVLMATFTSLHSPNAKLSVGARALSKHCHRDTSRQWWGSCTGSEEAKNAHAVERVTTILREAVWINTHLLPHNVKVIEVRTKEGYGARWSHDGLEFRGFVEPQMTDGHLLSWRH